MIPRMDHVWFYLCGMMKNILTAILIALTVTANAQNVKFGVEVGANIIPVRSSELGADFQFGIYGGFGAKFRVNERFAIGTGLFVSQQKKMYSSTQEDSFFEQYATLFQFAGVDVDTVESTLDGLNINTDIQRKTAGRVSEMYLRLPIMVHYRTDNFNVSIGPYVGVLLGAKRKEQVTSTVPFLQVVSIDSLDPTGLLQFLLPPTEDVTVNSFSDRTGLQGFDVGATVGVGYNMDPFLVELSFSQGFLDYRTGTHGSFSGQQSIRLSLSYYLPIKKKNKDDPEKKVKKKKTNPTL